ncbi:F-box/LRR-repeat protein 25-like [Carex rostrata]
MESVDISSRGNFDFISRLPDPILHNILGLLNTKEAVQTCVLSKRWEHLWTSLSSLNFEWKGHLAFLNMTTESVKLGKFVDTFLQRREPLNLDVFRLPCFKFQSMNACQVSNWIRYAVNHNTRVLHITYDGSVPCCIYTCTSLEELYLGFPCIDSSVPIINLPKLRKLTIRYEHLNSGNVKNLLSGCRTLEFLRLDSCFFIECIIISHECLKHLAIVNCYRDGTSLFINTPNLLSFSYDGKLSKTTLNMPSLTFASLVRCNSLTNTSSEEFVTFFCSLTNAEFLELHLECSLHQVCFSYSHFANNVNFNFFRVQSDKESVEVLLLYRITLQNSKFLKECINK